METNAGPTFTWETALQMLGFSAICVSEGVVVHVSSVARGDVCEASIGFSYPRSLLVI